MKIRGFFETFRFRIVGAFSIVLLLALISMVLTVEVLLIPTMQSKIKQELTNSTKALTGSISANAHALIRNNLKAIAQLNVEIAMHHLSMVDQGLISRAEAIQRLRTIILSQRVGSSGYIYCIDQSGTIVVHPNKELEQTNISHFEFVREQIKRKNGYIEYEWKNPGEKASRQKALYMIYFEPLDWIISVSSYRSEFNQLLDLEDFRETVSSLKFGKSGYAYVLDKEGKILIHPSLPYLSDLFKENITATDTLKSMLFQDNGMLEYSWKNPTEKVPREKIAIFQRMPEYGWIIVSSAYKEEVMLPVVTLKRMSYVSIFLISLFAGCTAWILSVRLSKPINAMRRQLIENSRKGTNVPLPVFSNDELGSLAREFNRFFNEVSEQSEILRKERERYHSLFETSPDGIFLFCGPHIIDCNSAACNLFSCEKSQLIGCTVEDLSPPMQYEGRTDDLLAKNLANLTPDHEMQTFEWLHKSKDGRFFTGEVRLKTFGWENSEPLLVSFLRDISEQKRIKEALLLTQFSFDKAPIGIIYLGNQCQFLNINEQARRDLGYSEAELSKLALFDINPNFDRKDIDEMWQRLGDEKIINFESVQLRKDGSEFPVEVTVKLLEYKQQQYSLAFVQDISERKNDEKMKAMMQANLEQSQRLDSLGVLAGGIAHDFNNILSAINGYTDLTKMLCADNQKVQHFLSQLSTASSRAKNLVHQILNFSKQSGLEKHPIDISRVINEALELIRATIPTTIEITKAIPANLGVVLANETQIHQIVMNLCTNAYHAIPDEAGSIDIELCPITITDKDRMNYPDLYPGEYVKFIISDTGSGISPEILSNIFDPYFTTKKPGEGTGLGLSTVHGIVKDHGGTIKVYSEMNQGTIFQILLPLEDYKETECEGGNDDLPRGNETILFVDDEKLLLEIGKEMLEGLGYQVETRASSIDTLAAFKAQPHKYDLVISDMTMPKFTGDSLAAELKKIAPELPIILCTGFSTRLNANKLLALGVGKVLMKPVTMKELATNIRLVLDPR